MDSNEASVCSGHGTCVSPDSCLCKMGYDGNTCQYAVKFPVLYGMGKNDQGQLGIGNSVDQFYPKLV
jgi:hypothetical protein